MKIWAKTVKKEKIFKDVVFEYEQITNLDEFVATLQKICELLDIPTPVATYINLRHFVMFNNTRFKARDFIESVDFDMLDIEAVPDRKKK